ncbi:MULTISPECIES: gamma-glutamylcyclotransferase [Marinobacter]|jgi:cation transport protein ChaC|uniref:gamma-glutamylcyclotransferase n=1 Tax=Marinobacter TaxID=2742 RepID=UPI0003B821F2|nr:MULTISPECIES: gamma-glutamylcyclotransferase [Marinobacter]ERS08727.1 gamma-glutamyl cyclotransferase [Marinobacter sp. EN3]RKR72044.1 cation transport protein ChaC [Marinobacter nauticus]
MPANTIEHNRSRFNFDGIEAIWLFGYGSLIYKVDFPFLEQRPAAIRGWARRFWQGSHDHRGTPEAPGRVVTLIEQPDAVCKGVAYRVSPNVFEYLDVREKNGYLRFSTTMTFDDGSHAEGLVYIATEDNEAFLGEAPEADIARQIALATGPSGPNSEYLLRLADSLRQLGDDCSHTFAIEACLRADELPTP